MLQGDLHQKRRPRDTRNRVDEEENEERRQLELSQRGGLCVVCFRQCSEALEEPSESQVPGEMHSSEGLLQLLIDWLDKVYQGREGWRERTSKSKRVRAQALSRRIA